MQKLISFAQDKEDIILYHILQDVKDVFWIDVGANDSVYMSVTKFFYDRGGRGINIEPQKKYYDEYRRERERDINLCIGIGEHNDTMILYGTGTGASLIPNDSEKNEVSIRRLEDVCDEYADSFDEIHFLKIDVEGFEKEALNGMNFKKYRPWIITMESTIPGTDIPNYEQWEYILLENKYVMAKQIGINRYYVAIEKSELLEKFSEVDEIDSKYSVIKMYEYFDIAEKYIQLEEKYNAIVNSKCWKYTAPIRCLGKKND